jgi:hypothetical protein
MLSYLMRQILLDALARGQPYDMARPKKTATLAVLTHKGRENQENHRYFLQKAAFWD